MMPRSEALRIRWRLIHRSAWKGYSPKFAATVLLSIVVLIVVTLFVSLGVLWWTGDGTQSVLI